jgi:hypothetical protein
MKFELARLSAEEFVLLAIATVWPLCSSANVGTPRDQVKGVGRGILLFPFMDMAMLVDVSRLAAHPPIAIGDGWIAVDDPAGAPKPLDACPGTPRVVVAVRIAVVAAVPVVGFQWRWRR